jgi:DNA-binding NtrC family response regulator
MLAILTRLAFHNQRVEMGQHDRRPIRIFVIDDEEDVRKLLRIWLEQAEFVVYEAANGLEAAAICRSSECSLVICDLFMDQKEGLETIQELRKEFSTIKLIAISGGGSNKMLELLPIARVLGAAETLSKPLDRATFLESVHRVLGSQAS